MTPISGEEEQTKTKNQNKKHNQKKINPQISYLINKQWEQSLHRLGGEKLF